MARQAEILTEVPLDAIREIAQHHPDVKISIKRQDAAGRWATIKTREVVPTATLGSLEDHVRSIGGGGKYRIDAFNLDNELERLVPPFWVVLEGPSKPHHEIRPSAQPVTTPSYGDYRGGQYFQPPYEYQGGGDDQVNPMGKFYAQTPDAIAMEQNRELREELREARAAREQERSRNEQQLRALQTQIMEMGRQHSQEVQRQEMAALRAEIAAARALPPPRPDTLSPMIAALVPVFTAVVNGMSQRSAAGLQAQNDSMKMHMEGIKTLVTAPGKNKEMDLGKLLIEGLPVLIPLVTKLLDDRSSMPSKMAELVTTLGENNMHMLSMVSEFMKNNDTGESPMMTVLRQAIDGGLEIAKHLTDVSRAGVPGSNASKLSSGAGAGNGQQLTPKSPPAEFAKAIFNSPDLPDIFRTKKWFNLFAAIHDANTPAEIVAKELAKHLEALDEADVQVPAFEGLFEADSDPKAYIERFMSGFPLAKYDLVRAQEIIDVFSEAFMPADEDEDELPVVTPAPRSNGAMPQAFEAVDAVSDDAPSGLSVGLRKS